MEGSPPIKVFSSLLLIKLCRPQVFHILLLSKKKKKKKNLLIFLLWITIISNWFFLFSMTLEGSIYIAKWIWWDLSLFSLKLPGSICGCGGLFVPIAKHDRNFVIPPFYLKGWYNSKLPSSSFCCGYVV